MPMTRTPQPKRHLRINDNFLQSFTASWHAEGLGERTITEYVRHLRGFARYLNDSFLVATRQDLEAHVTAEINRLCPASAAYTARALRRFYAWLLLEEEIDKNPALHLKTPKVPEPVTKIAAVEDVQKMIAQCRTGLFAPFKHRRDLALLLMIRGSGMRISEIARVEVSHIDLIGRAIIIPRTKTGKPRIAPLDPPAVRAISAYLRVLDPDDSGIVWRTEAGAHLRLSGVKQAFERLAKRAGVKVTPHQLRRAFAGEFMRRGGSQNALKALAGWASDQMVSRYLGAQQTEIALEEHRRLYAS